MSAFGDKALERADSVLVDLYDSVIDLYPNYIVHELNDAVTVARAFLTGQATPEDNEMLEGWTGTTDPLVWTQFCQERSGINHLYRQARQAQGNLHRKLEADVKDKSDAEVSTLMLTWCDTMELFIGQLPVNDEAKGDALYRLSRLRLTYGTEA